MKESIVEVRSLICRHASILPRLAVEHNIDGDKSSAKNCASYQELLDKRSLARRLRIGLRLRLVAS